MRRFNPKETEQSNDNIFGIITTAVAVCDLVLAAGVLDVVVEEVGGRLGILFHLLFRL